MRMAVIITTITALAACGRATEPADWPGDPVPADAGDTITLRYGQTALLGSTVRLTFRSVETDSRCPVNVVCVWAGDAAIRLDALRPGEPWTAFVLHVNGEPGTASVGDYIIELLDVAPARSEPDSPRPADYSVRLAISRG